MGDPVVHFEVLGKDASALQRFYASAFGWEMKPAVPGYAMAHPNTNGSINGGVGAMDGYAGHVTFYVQVDDLTKALSKIEKLGGRRLGEPRPVPGGSIAMFSDPEGHVLGLFHGQLQGSE